MILLLQYSFILSLNQKFPIFLVAIQGWGWSRSWSQSRSRSRNYKQKWSQKEAGAEKKKNFGSATLKNTSFITNNLREFVLFFSASKYYLKPGLVLRTRLILAVAGAAPAKISRVHVLMNYR